MNGSFLLTGTTLLLFATIVSIELIRSLHIFASFGQTASAAQRAIRIVPRTGVSEWAKEQALRLASIRLMGSSLKAAGLLLIVAAPLLLCWSTTHWYPVGVRRSLMDGRAQLALLLLTGGYALLRRKVRIKPDTAERVLQRVALGNRALLDATWMIERRLHAQACALPASGPPVFITGLARAGTSVLTRLLHETGEFASLTYRDLPFPLAPNGWARLSDKMHRHVSRRERGHGDGLSHDLDSPEAIEEIFWLSQEGDTYRQSRGLVPVPPTAQSVTAFRDYTALIRHRYGKGRYLSKNNNNILRLPALVQACPDAILLHPFRDPVEQSSSLLNQHLRACQMAQEDRYRRDFMRWLGHHEFGADHRPFLFDDTQMDGDRSTINYWLRCWISSYRFLLSQPAPVSHRQIFLDYDALCRSPDAAFQRLATQAKLRHAPSYALISPQVRGSSRRASPLLLTEAHAVYQQLLQRVRFQDERSNPTSQHMAA